MKQLLKRQSFRHLLALAWPSRLKQSVDCKLTLTICQHLVSVSAGIPLATQPTQETVLLGKHVKI